MALTLGSAQALFVVVVIAVPTTIVSIAIIGDVKKYTFIGMLILL
jgi:hypothetical protein